MNCPFCYQPKTLISEEKHLCLNIEQSPRTHAFNPDPYQAGGRGYSLVDYLEKYGLTLKQYRSLSKEEVTRCQ